jgi:hypothetical protein
VDGPSGDRRAAHTTGLNSVDELKHLAQVRVAGSNPVFRTVAVTVFRSFAAGQSGVFNFERALAELSGPPGSSFAF